MDPAQWPAQTDACIPQTTGPNGPDRIAKPTYDNANHVIAVTTALGTADATIESTTYSDDGLVKTIKDGESNLTTNEYDGHDRLVKTRYPVPTKGANASSTTDFDALAYDPNGNVTTRTQRDGSTIAFTYDNLGRITTRTPQGESVVNYGYNLLGQPLQIQRSADGVTQTYSYDGLGQLSNEAQPFGSIAYQHDLAGRTTRLTWSDGLYVSYDFDNLGNVTAIRENGAASGVGVLASYSYDNLSRRTGITRGNGTTTSYTFDPVSRLATLGHDLAGTGSDLTIGPLAYNPAGQIASMPRSNDAYAWAGAANVDRPYTANGLNQYSTAGVTALSYDPRGNLTALGSINYGYNKLNQLVTSPGVAMAYDPAGRLIEYDTSTSTRFVYAGNRLVSEVANPGGATLRRYVPGPGTDEVLVWYEGGGTSDRRWLHGDERGSVIAVSDGSGTMLAINRYDEYGNPQSSNAGRFQYTGQVWLPELGLYNYKARVYSPTLGRFMQTDPIGYGDGLNWYNYAGSDPVNGSDPDGTVNQHDLGEVCTGTRLCNRDGSSPGWVVSSLGPSQGGVGGNRRIGGSLAVSCNNCGSPGQDGADQNGSIVTVSAPTYSYSYSPGAFFLIAAAGAPQRVQSPTPCQLAFLKNQLGNRGMPTSQLNSLKFVSGLDSNANALTSRAFNGGAVAVTQGSTVYVQPGSFDSVANFRSPTGFEEAYHTAQFASDSGFYSTYGILSIGGLLATGDSYNGNVYEAFAKGASRQMFEASKTGMCPK